ncbi:MAG: ATP-binding protein [Saprospiraceae bacterium]
MLKFSGRIILTTYLFGILSAIYIVAMVYYTGGINSSFIFWVITLPIIATFIAVHIDLIYYTTAVAILIYIAFLILNEQGFETPNLIPIDFSMTYNIVINQILILITIVAILIFYYSQNQSYNKQLETSNENLERFASVASHDLKAPLRNIISFTQLLKRKIKKQQNDSDALEFLGFIEANGKQMNELIQGLLDFSKLQTDQLIAFETIDLNETITKVKGSFKINIEENQASIEAESLPIINANKLQIKQLFQNIIGNGLKYNRSKIPSVQITYKQENKQFHFFIKDNGIGIDESYFDKIFEMFLRLNSAAEFQGTGIGLAICKKIAMLHGGNLSVFESSNDGTTFKLTLPIR